MGLFQGDGPKPSKHQIQAELRCAMEIYKKNDVELILCEYFRNIIEMEWAIEVAHEFNLPVAATMCMGPCGDENGVSVGECAIRMARAGADLVGVNCLFDPFVILDVMKSMKEALDLFGLSPYLMAQPNGYRSPGGRRGSGPGRLTTSGSGLLEAAVGLSLITSELWLRSSWMCGANSQWPRPSLTMTSPFTRSWRRSCPDTREREILVTGWTTIPVQDDLCQQQCIVN